MSSSASWYRGSANEEYAVIVRLLAGISGVVPVQAK